MIRHPLYTPFSDNYEGVQELFYDTLLSGNKVYGSYKTSDSEYIIETQYEEMVIDKEFWNALYSYHE